MFLIYKGLNDINIIHKESVMNDQMTAEGKSATEIAQNYLEKEGLIE